MKLPVDGYVLRARLLPVLFVGLPGALAAFAWFPEAEEWWMAVGWLIVGSGVPTLLAHLGRDRGKRKERDLYDNWGGKPTTRLLRHREASNRVILRRRHERLATLLAAELPGPSEEAADPRHADEMYEACVQYLIENTRDKDRFRLIYEENVGYGFRRNLWGLKPLGIVVTAISGGAGGALAYMEGTRVGGLTVTTSLLVALILAILVVWLLVVTPSWVRLQAEAYAERLLGALEVL